MKLSVMFWNVWYENQLSMERLNILEEALGNFVSEKHPDVVCLNEVVMYTDDDRSPVNEIMSSLGYTYGHLAQTNRINAKFAIGSSIYSKTKIYNPKSVVLGENTSSKRKGHTDHAVFASVGVVVVAGRKIQIVSAHPVNIKPSTLKDHYLQTSNLKNFASDLLKFNEPIIIGGDINEPRFIPFSFRSKINQNFHHKSGSFMNPSWRYRGQTMTLIRANLDRIFWSRNRNFSLTSFSIIDTNVSDHRPLISVFEIEK